MTLQDGCLVIPERLGDPLSLAGFMDDPGEILEDHMVLEECACVLRDGIEQAPERRPRFPVDRMRMRRRDHIRAGVMDARMDRKGGNVGSMLTLYDFTVRVHQDQVGRADMPEMHTKGIDPEMIRSRRIACRNVSGHAFVETEFGKQAERSGQAFFAMLSFLVYGRELRNSRDFKDVWGWGSHLTPRAEIIRSGLLASVRIRIILDSYGFRSNREVVPACYESWRKDH